MLYSVVLASAVPGKVNHPYINIYAHGSAHTSHRFEFVFLHKWDYTLSSIRWLYFFSQHSFDSFMFMYINIYEDDCILHPETLVECLGVLYSQNGTTGMNWKCSGCLVPLSIDHGLKSASVHLPEKCDVLSRDKEKEESISKQELEIFSS